MNKLLSPPNKVTRDIILRPGCGGAPGVGGSHVVVAVTCVVRPGCRGWARRGLQVSLCIRCHQYLHCDPPPPSLASVTQVSSYFCPDEQLTTNSHCIELNFNYHECMSSLAICSAQHTLCVSSVRRISNHQKTFPPIGRQFPQCNGNKSFQMIKVL